MTSAAATIEPRATSQGAETRPGLLRLSGVELRKMVDTRAGFWLLLGIVLTTITVVVVFGFDDGHDQSLRSMFADSAQVALALLPVVGILLVSSEWTQRTSLITFALVPQRRRVLAAKLSAGVALAVVAWVVILAIAAVGTAVVGGGEAEQWSLPGWFIGQSSVYLAVSMLLGVAFGAMLLSSAPAIVLYFLVPLGFAALGSMRVFDGVRTWLDGSQSLAPLTTEQMGASDWAHAGTTIAVWMLLPLVIGLWRITRSEIT